MPGNTMPALMVSRSLLVPNGWPSRRPPRSYHERNTRFQLVLQAFGVDDAVLCPVEHERLVPGRDGFCLLAEGGMHVADVGVDVGFGVDTADLLEAEQR